MNGRILAVLVVVVLAASHAQAAPITVSAGDTLVFNFDLTGASPAPPYSSLSLRTGLDPNSVDGSDSGTWFLFADLDATGDVLTAATALLFGIVEEGGPPAPGVPTTLDGIFSAKLVLTSGSLVIDPCAAGTIVTGAETSCVAPASVTAVPEPMTVSLMGAGLAGMLAWRRRRPA